MDDEDDFMLDGDDDGFGSGGDDAFFDDDDEAGGEGMEMEETAENLYYKVKSSEGESPEQTEKDLRKIVELDEQNRSEYGFKALKKLMKLMLHDSISATHDQIVGDFKKLLSYSNLVSVNVAEKGINSVLDVTATTKKLDLMEELAGLSAECFQSGKNERAWFRTNLKLAQMMFEAGQTISLPEKLAGLLEWCEIAPGVNNPRKESFLLEVLALQMQCAVSGTVTGKKGLRRLVTRARGIQSAIPHPRTLGTIHECSGKVMLYEHKWSIAKQEFFDAFKNYDESGSPRRIDCLRYIVLAALLENTKISPFESPETKSLVSNEKIIPVVELWDAFEDFDVVRFKDKLKNAFASDQFAAMFLPIVERSFQFVMVENIVKAYSKVRISFVAQKLMVNEEDCERILSELIMDGRLNGYIDQVRKVLCLNQEGDKANMKYNALTQWSSHLEQVTSSVSKKVMRV